MDLILDVKPGNHVELDDGAVVLVEQDRGNGRFRVRRGDQSFNIGLKEITKILHHEPQGFWEEFRSRLGQGPLPAHLSALVAAAKVDGKSRPLFTWGTVDAIPYLFQYTPLFALRRSPWGRVLVADETGLGKTIEAGIVIMELLEADEGEGGIRDTLVIGPKSLYLEWKLKLSKHFGLHIEQIGAKDLVTRIEGRRPPGKEGQIHFLSMDALPSFLKQTSMKASTIPADRLYDLIVVDEAHHFKAEGAQRSRALKILLGDPFPKDQDEFLRPIPKLLLLTATPLSTHLDNLQSYFTYMDPGLAQVGGIDVRKEAFREEHHKVILARRIAHLAIRLMDDPSNFDLQKRIRRDLAEFPTQPANREEFDEFESSDAIAKVEDFLSEPAVKDASILAEALLGLDPWSDQIVRNTRRGVGMHGDIHIHIENLSVDLHPAEQRLVNSAPWVLHEHPFGQLAIRQQMSSSLPAYLFRHLLGLSDVDIAAELLLDQDTEEDSPDLSTEEQVRLAILRKVHDAPKDEDALVAVPDGKFDRLKDAMKRFFNDLDQRGALLFTRYTATAEYLKRRISAVSNEFGNVHIYYIHGGVKHLDRTRMILEAQTCPDKYILILTEVGQEGIDLQFATGVFHYDLPWNPMRIVQRNGRVHRIGQKAKDIYLYTFYVNGTLDDNITRAIAERMDLVCKTFGEIPEGLVGLDPGAEMSRIIGDRVRLEVYSGLRGFKSASALESQIQQDAESLRNQTRQIQIHKEQITKAISEDAESCQAWFPLLREALYGSWGSMERVLQRDLVALLKWASGQPKINIRAEAIGQDQGSWRIRFGPYRLPLPPNAKIARAWKKYEDEGQFIGILLADEGGKRPDVDTASVLHMDHPFIRDLASRALRVMDPPMAMAVNPLLSNPHCLISIAFSVEEAGRTRAETRWFLLEQIEGPAQIAHVLRKIAH
mgnify:CR=1 FL=1